MDDLLSRVSVLRNCPGLLRSILGNIPLDQKFQVRSPELDDADIREVPAHSWRVIYQLRGESVFIVTLVHRRRAPAPEQLRG
jgi:hypothetical protein